MVDGCTTLTSVQICGKVEGADVFSKAQTQNEELEMNVTVAKP